MCVASGLGAADLLTSKDGMQQLGKNGTQQIGLGTVRQRGSRVVQRANASPAEEPKPLLASSQQASWERWL
jgi:hypothetical protein